MKKHPTSTVVFIVLFGLNVVVDIIYLLTKLL